MLIKILLYPIILFYFNKNFQMNSVLMKKRKYVHHRISCKNKKYSPSAKFFMFSIKNIIKQKHKYPQIKKNRMQLSLRQFILSNKLSMYKEIIVMQNISSIFLWSTIKKNKTMKIMKNTKAVGYIITYI